MAKGEALRDAIFLTVTVRFSLDPALHHARGTRIHFHWVSSSLIWAEPKEVKFGRISSELSCFVSTFPNTKTRHLKQILDLGSLHSRLTNKFVVLGNNGRCSSITLQVHQSRSVEDQQYDYKVENRCHSQIVPSLITIATFSCSTQQGVTPMLSIMLGPSFKTGYLFVKRVVGQFPKEWLTSMTIQPSHSCCLAMLSLCWSGAQTEFNPLFYFLQETQWIQRSRMYINH